MTDRSIAYSLVVPLYNEDANVKPLCANIKAAMDGLNKPYEVILVNDGSIDNTLHELRNIRTPSFTIIVLAKHYGQSIALQAGFAGALGNIIITMDGDLQNDPQDIPLLLGKLDEGYDVVCGWRTDRKDPLIKKISSRVAYWFRKLILQDPMHDVGCTLRVFRREVLTGLFLSPGMHVFFTVIMSRLGYKITEIKVRHHARRFCRSKYNIHNRLLPGILLAYRFVTTDIHRLIKRTTHYSIKEVISG